MDDLQAARPSPSLAPAGSQLRQQVSPTTQPIFLKARLIATRFLARLTPSSAMERSNYFIEVRPPHESLLDTLHRPSGLVEQCPDPSPRDIIVRRERQTFRRLPRTSTILFGVKTILTPLDELSVQELQNLAKEIRSWPDCVGEYKGNAIWGAKALEFCRQRTQMLGFGEKVEV